MECGAMAMAGGAGSGFPSYLCSMACTLAAQQIRRDVPQGPPQGFPAEAHTKTPGSVCPRTLGMYCCACCSTFQYRTYVSSSASATSRCLAEGGSACTTPAASCASAPLPAWKHSTAQQTHWANVAIWPSRYSSCSAASLANVYCPLRISMPLFQPSPGLLAPLGGALARLIQQARDQLASKS